MEWDRLTDEQKRPILTRAHRFAKLLVAFNSLPSSAQEAIVDYAETVCEDVPVSDVQYIAITQIAEMLCPFM